MPIGLVSDDLLQRELDSCNGNRVSSPEIQVLDRSGRKEGDTNVPDSLRKIIGEEAILNGRQSALQIAETFGVSASSVSAYAKGATSTTTYDTPSKSLIGHINKSRARHIKKASHVLSSALAAISQDKLDYTDAKDLSGIAKDMSVIIKNLEPREVDTPDSKAGVQFVIFAPQFREEKSFDVIQVNE